MQTRFTILILIILSPFSGLAQKKVNSDAYNLMLKTLLSHSVKEVSVREIQPISNMVVFVDSREKSEFNVSHIKNAIWVGYNDFDISRMAGIDKEKKVIVYCAVGARSENISEKLLADGYTDVANLYGGIFEWVNEGNPVYNNQGKTNKVHAYSKTWGIWLKAGDKVYYDDSEK